MSRRPRFLLLCQHGLPHQPLSGPQLALVRGSHSGWGFRCAWPAPQARADGDSRASVNAHYRFCGRQVLSGGVCLASDSEGGP